MSEPNYHTTNTKTFFTEHLLAIEMKKKKKPTKKQKYLQINLWLSILELSKILMYEFWHDYVYT